MNGTDKTRESFVFYRSFYDSISHCPDDVQIVLFRAVIEYGLDQAVPDFAGTPYQPFIEAIWAGIRPQLDANHKRFLNGCKGGEFGRLGGAPKGNTNARKDKQPQINPETTPNVNVNDNVNDNVGLFDSSPTVHRALNLPFTNREFVDTWKELMTQPKWKGKTDRALQMSLNQLSKYPVEFAVLLIQNAIAGNYQAVVFNDTPARFENWKRVNPTTTADTGEVITRIEDIYKD